MSRLFSELYIDEDVSALLAKLLRSRGFVVTSALDAGLLGAATKNNWRTPRASKKRCSPTIEFTSKFSSSNTTPPAALTAA